MNPGDLPGLAGALPNLPVPTGMTEDWEVDDVDQLRWRNRVERGRYEPVGYTYNELHQVVERTHTDPADYTWDVNGNLKTRTNGLYGDAVFTHDWRDRLTGVEQGSVTTDILLDPRGRMVGKVRHTPDGDIARAYLHDGPGGPGVRPGRGERHLAAGAPAHLRPVDRRSR